MNADFRVTVGVEMMVRDCMACTSSLCDFC
jgi:hypothetical protein